MKKVASVLLVAVLVAESSPSFARQDKKLLQDRPGAAKAEQLRPSPPMLDIIQGLYISQLQQLPDFTDEQRTAIIPPLKEYLRVRSEIGGPRRQRALNQLRQAVNRGAADEEIAKLIQEFDHIDGDVVAAREKFFASADPLLNVRQRARLRIFQVNMEHRISLLIQLSKTSNPTPRREN